MIVIVGGIPGVGKSTVLDLFKRRAEGMGRGVRIINYGTVMFEEAHRRGVGHRDEMRRLPIDVQREIQISAAEEIAGAPGDIKIVDTHFSIRTSSGYLPGIPSIVASRISPTHLVVVRADPDEILSRRGSDGTRIRDMPESADAVREEMEMEILYAVSTSTITGAPLIIVDNRQGEAERASEDLTSKLGI